MRSPKLPDARIRRQARRLFGTDPIGYEQGRPDYPERVYDVLTSRCGIGPGAAVVEIGPGTGRVTQRLVALGASVVGVEPDAALAAYLRDLMAGTSAEVVDGAFEKVTLPEDHFDLAVAAMSFHWVDQARGLPKLGRIVRPGGWVALWWTLFGDPSRPDPFDEATRHLLEPPTVEAGKQPRFELDESGWEHNLTRRAGLRDFNAELIRWTVRLDSEELRALYASMIRVRQRPARERRALLDKLVSIALTDFGGIVERPFVTSVYTARRPSSSLRPR